MPKAQSKTRRTLASVAVYIAAIADDARRADCRALVTLMSTVVGEAPRMWGPSIVGFGSYHYTYESGHEGDSPPVGFSSRKPDISVYLAVSGPVMRSFSRAPAARFILRQARAHEQYDRVLDNLRKRGNSRPRALATLKSSVAALLPKDTSAATIDALLKRLQSEGVVTVMATEVAYELK